MSDTGRARDAAVARWLGVDAGLVEGLTEPLRLALEARMQEWHDGTLSAQLADLLRREADRFREEAETDPLTGLLNRRGLLSRLAAGPGAWTDIRTVGMVVVDVDDLKVINDTHGHLAGDTVLLEVGRRLREAVRRGDLVARIGGDEFVLVLPNVDEVSIRILVGKIHACISASEVALPGGATVAASVSLGRSVGSVDTAASELLEAADRAMYLRKRSRAVAD